MKMEDLHMTWLNFGKTISSFQKRIWINTHQKLEQSTYKRITDKICKKSCWYHKPLLKYLWVASKVGMAFYSTIKAKKSQNCKMVLTQDTILKQFEEDDSIYLGLSMNVMASTTIYTIEHILEEKSTKKDRDSRKKSSLKKGKGKKKVKHVKVAESEPPPEEVKLEEEDSGNLEEILKEIDAKLDKHHELERCMQRLKKLRIKYPDDPQLLWRIGKACQKMAEKEKNVQTKLSHVEKGIEHCQKSMDMDNKQADAHKWFAILIGYKGQYQSTREKIACGKQFKKHLDIALFLNPSDPVLQHMAGRFCLEIVSLPWVERKIAKSMFTDPINCSIDIAMDHFLQAEKFMGQGEWKENRMLIAKCHILREDYKKALEWLDKAKHANDDSAGETINKEIDELLKKYSKYR